MSLPMLNTTTMGQMDVSKQIGSIRLYLNQLRDELEYEIGHITYDNLDPSLRKKIDAIQDTVLDARKKADFVAESVSANYLSAKQVAAKYASINYIEANYVQTTALEANYVKTSVLEANYVKTSVLESNYTKTSVLKAKYATFDSLKDGTTVIDGGNILTGTISADRIDAYTLASQKFGSATINCYVLDASHGINYQSKAIVPISCKDANGNVFTALGYR